ncbi:MAG: DUF4097 family beta strand repeat-containing protein [Acidobacteriota bacterium]
MKRTMIVLAAVLAAAAALAQQDVNERRPAAKDGVVEIENVAGSVRVVGWDRLEVEVTGSLGRGTERLEFSGSPERTLIKVVLPRHAHDVDGSHLTVKVPGGSRVEANTVSADITVEQVSGALSLESVSGEVKASGTPIEVKASSVSGSIEISAGTASTRVKSVSGDVTLVGAGKAVEASSVSGRVSVAGDDVENGELETTSGSIRFDASLAKNGRLDVKTVSGDAELILPASVMADFHISTFSGDIDNELGPAARRSSEYGPGKELDFTTAGGGARVWVKTFSGSVSLRKK